MATTQVTCPVGTYTQIGSGATVLSFRIKTMTATTRVRLANAASAPAADTTNYITISDREWQSMSNITNNIYVMPIDSNAVLEVIDNT